MPPIIEKLREMLLERDAPHHLQAHLRSGDHAPGPPPVSIINERRATGRSRRLVAFTAAEKLAIALAIEAAGVDEIEAEVPAMVQEIATLAAIASMSRARPLPGAPMAEADVDAALPTGIGRVHSVGAAVRLQTIR